MEIYAFEWCGCISEEGFHTESIHATKRGAFKAMTKAANDRWQSGRDQTIEFRGKFMFVKDELQQERWRVRSLHVQP